ncbi:hypothetical protein PENCOP_c009G01999 [Penicillium coprophilum]|uniref:LysM domain-containing protein n=1 Tax=Penicillium coprophilum TaxID=36646 RepID=A0A1V6UHA6_9EURO|nr:hypothetical protein PENCOP_c009G01999 [Penicillium coprophilum]
MNSIPILLSLLFVPIAVAYSGHAAGNSHDHTLTKRTAFAPGGDGACHAYTIQNGESCAKLAERYRITTSNIETWNNGAWGWSGCANIKQGDFVCLSSGTLPMPVALPRATCGPQVPGTRRPGKYSDLASLNPCPSNQCCGASGQCGTSSSFCDVSKGCLSNCGVKSTPKETTTKKVTSKVSSKTTVAETISKTTSKTTVSKTTTSGTKSKSTTTTKPHTTEKPKVTMTSIKSIRTSQTKTTSSFNPAHSWQITIYTDDKCKGDYFTVDGHESKTAGNCLVFKDNKQTEIADTKTSCRWWTNRGLHWDTCSTSKLVAPRSWYITQGQCLFFKNKHCKDEDWLGQTYPPEKGCQSRTSGYLSPQLKGYMVTGAGDWGSMQCFYQEKWK